MSGQVLPGDEGGDDPKDERQNLVIFISVGLVLTRERKELAIQETTENYVLLAFVMPGLVLTRGRRR